ncbi:MAG: hydroxyisourate hydrolase [Oligoflexia bacterium]|nr:hydroxyisourate hydrolase [Oligoflexia bacterium]
MISTHILDTHVGMPAPGVEVNLDRKEGDSWKRVDTGITNDDGRIAYNCPSEEGVYRLNFEIADYFQKKNQDFFFIEVPIIFQVKDTNRKYHVPLLLNPFGISSYRGS